MLLYLHPRSTGEAAALKLAIAPIVIMFLSHLVFDQLGFGINGLLVDSQKYLCQTTIPTLNFSDTKARLVWATTALFYYVILLSISFLSIRLIVRNLSDKGRKIYTAVAVVLILLALSHLLFSGYSRNNFSTIYFYTFDALNKCTLYGSQQLNTIKVFIFGINVLSAIAPVLILLGGCSVFASEKDIADESVTALKNKMVQLKMCVNGASALMVAGVLHMFTWLRWPGFLITDTVLSSHSLDLAEKIAVYWGTTFSLLIAALYISGVSYLSGRTAALLEVHPEVCEGEKTEEWLRKQGLSFSPLQQIPQILAVFAPILTGPIGSTLTSMTGSII